MARFVLVESDPVQPCEDGCTCRSCEYQRTEDERHQRVKACPGHEWEMELDHPEDGSGVTLSCAHCPADADDVYPDGTEMLYAELDNGVKVDAGKHDSPVQLVVPVDVAVENLSRWTDYGWEYDAELIVEQRGPVRPVPEGES